MTSSDDGRPVWDEDDAQGLIGATVLIGITRKLADGLAQEQFHGRIKSVHETNGIVVALDGARTGEDYRLPADLASLTAARPGEYRLRSTGEVLVDPDFICTWTVTPPDR